LEGDCLAQAQVKIKCSVCGVEMHLAQKLSFRIGGTRGEWKLLVGEWAELGEELLPLYVCVCPQCGRIELFADEKTKGYLLKITPPSFLKKCVGCGKQIPIASEECQYCGAKQK